MWFEFVALAIIGYLLYILLSKSSPPKYWKEHGIQEIDSSVVASTLEIILGKRSIMHRDEYAYEKLGSGKFCGMKEFSSPVILVKDLELIKKIVIKDFDYFMNRREFFPLANKDGILAKMVGFLKGDKWKDVRTSFSPNFTSGKMRKMMGHFNDVGLEWIQMLKNQTIKNGGSTTIEVLNAVNQFSVEVIATSVFGMRSGSIGNTDTLFYKMANRIADPGLVDMVKLNLAPRFPKIFMSLGIEVLDMEAIGFFENILRQSMEARLNGSVKRNDFQQMLIDTMKGEQKDVGSDELSSFEKEAMLGGEVTSTTKGRYMTKDTIVANSIVFFIAGTQTTSGFISFAMYVLAAYPDIQDKLSHEVDQIIKEDGSVDYDELGRLTYMEMFTSEVLRLYPAAFRLEREANKDYHDKETGLFVPKGVTVVIPVKSIHYDPKYYPNPLKFDPENFSAERKAERSPYAYMPFGIGPRSCILSSHYMGIS